METEARGSHRSPPSGRAMGRHNPFPAPRIPAGADRLIRDSSTCNASPAGRLMATFQAQAVLRRTSQKSPLKLAGVTLERTFYPRNSAEATGPLTLTRGLVALAPLASVDAADAAGAAAIANVDARDAWIGLNEPEPPVGRPA